MASENGRMVSSTSGEQVWIERLGNLRNVIRQEVIGRQIDEHVEAGMSVLDVGCGQGTQGLRLAGQGCVVTGVDPSSDLLGRFAFWICGRGNANSDVHDEPGPDKRVA